MFPIYVYIINTRNFDKNHKVFYIYFIYKSLGLTRNIEEFCTKNISLMIFLCYDVRGKRSKPRSCLYDKVFDFGIPKYFSPITSCDVGGENAKNPGNI